MESGIRASEVIVCANDADGEVTDQPWCHLNPTRTHGPFYPLG
jgi:hypothetical protein